MKNATALPFLFATLAACSAINDSTPQNLGSTDAPIAATSSGAFHTDPSTFVGRWIGTAEDPLALESSADGAPPAYHFPSGSTQIVLDIQPQGALAGTLIFGAGEPPTEAPDAERGYPAGLDYEALFKYPGSQQGQAVPPLMPPTEGFAYVVQDLTFSTQGPLDDGLLHVYYRTTEVLSDWCELQQPFPDPHQPGYSCVEGDVGTLPDGTCRMFSRQPELQCPDGADTCNLPVSADLGPVDCNKAFLCENQYCACLDEGCSVAFEPALFRNRAELTLRRQGDDLVGVISNGAFFNDRQALAPIGRLRFQRAD